MDIRAIHERNFRADVYRWWNLEEDGRRFTHLLPKLTPVLKFGVALEYYGPLPHLAILLTTPHNRAHSIEF